jgi:hypothetical protein
MSSSYKMLVHLDLIGICASWLVQSKSYVSSLSYNPMPNSLVRNFRFLLFQPSFSKYLDIFKFEIQILFENSLRYLTVISCNRGYGKSLPPPRFCSHRYPNPWSQPIYSATFLVSNQCMISRVLLALQWQVWR